MSNKRQRPSNDAQLRLQGSIESMTELRDGIELTLRLNNPLERAIHYIADVRAIIFDPTTRRFRVRLSDQGREIIPGGMAMQPRFNVIDPHSESVIKVRLPKTIVKLTDTPSPTGEIRFEEHAIGDANEIELEIGWADTPYYNDPRDKSQDISPILSWEQQTLRVTFRTSTTRK